MIADRGMVLHQVVADVRHHGVLDALLIEQLRDHFPTGGELGIRQHHAQSLPGQIIDAGDLLGITLGYNQDRGQVADLDLAQQGAGLFGVLHVGRVRDVDVAGGLEFHFRQMIFRSAKHQHRLVAGRFFVLLDQFLHRWAERGAAKDIDLFDRSQRVASSRFPAPRSLGRLLSAAVAAAGKQCHGRHHHGCAKHLVHRSSPRTVVGNYLVATWKQLTSIYRRSRKEKGLRGGVCGLSDSRLPESPNKGTLHGHSRAVRACL